MLYGVDLHILFRRAVKINGVVYSLRILKKLFTAVISRSLSAIKCAEFIAA